MYDRVVDVPRLVSFHNLVDEPPPHPRLKQMRQRLNDTYAGELGEPFTTAGLCLYRDGNDSVAWHGDTIGRSSTQDTVVAIVELANEAMDIRAMRLLLDPVPEGFAYRSSGSSRRPRAREASERPTICDGPTCD